MDRRGYAAILGFAGLAYYLYLIQQRRKKPAAKAARSCGHEPIVNVFFGSQTGTAESFAKQLVEEANIELGLNWPDAKSVESIENWNAFFTTSSSNVFIIFLLSTYGEGDPSDDACKFDEWLKASACTDMKGINFAIFGLGNKQYALYNEMAKRTEKNLTRIGASQICKTGFGDDNKDIEQDFCSWKDQNLWRSLLSKIGLDYNHLKSVSASVLVRNPIDKCLLDLHISEKRSKLPFDATVQSFGGSDLLSKQFFSSNIVPVTKVVQLCAGKVQVDLDISKVPSLRYRSGDTLDVIPLNKREDWETLLSLYGLQEKKDFMISFTRKKSVNKTTVKKPFPTPCGLQTAIQKYLDLHGSPSRAFIRDIALVSGHSMEESERIADDVKKVSQNEVWTVIRILNEKFHNISKYISFSDLIQLLPKQKSRAYSICSSPLEDPKTISVVISRVDDRALASVYLSEIVKPNELVSVSLKQGSFRLPNLTSQPVIMIAVGTGIAPFRAFMVELIKRNRCKSAVLFFGCRSSSEWIYRKEMEDFQAHGGTLHVAFSRENKDGNVVYVQDLIRSEATMLKTLVDNNSIVYVCGSTKMGMSVMEEFDRSIADVSELRVQKRYCEELWG